MTESVNKKYLYLFITGRRVRERSVYAPNKYKAICKIRTKYPEVLQAGTEWVCLGETEDYKMHRNMLRTWHDLGRWGVTGRRVKTAFAKI